MRTISDQSHRVAQNFVWLSFQELMVRLLGLAAAMYLARKFTPSDYGALGIALAVVGVLGVAVSAGTGVRATRLTALDHASIPATYAVISGIRVTTALLLFVGLVVFSPFLGRYLSVPPALLAVTGLWLWRPALEVQWAFKGQDRMHVIAAGEVIEKSLMFLGLLVFVQGGSRELLRVPLVEAGAALVMVYFLFTRLGKNFSPLSFRFNAAEWPQFLRESVPATVAELMTSVHQHGSVLLLGLLLTAGSAASFVVSQKIMGTVISLLLVVNSSAFPSISRLMGEKTLEAFELQALLLRFFLVVTIPVALIAGIYASEVLGLLFGDSYRESWPVLVILLCALPFTIYGQSLQNVLLASANPKPVMLAKTFGVVAMLLLLVILIPKWETRGAALAFTIGEFLGMLLLIDGSRRHLKNILWNRATSGTVFAGMVMALIFILGAGWEAPGRIVMAVAAFVCSIFLFRGVRLSEVKDLQRLLTAMMRKGE